MSAWKKGSRSNGNGGNNCVEVREVRNAAGTLIGVAVRDSKNPDGPVLHFTPAEWDVFTDGVKAGEFD